VAVANLFIAKAIFERRVWSGALGAGAALGLAMLNKGPVAFVMTLAPAAAYGALAFVAAARRGPRSPEPLTGSRRAARRAVLAIITGTVLMFAIGLSWFLYVAATRGDQWQLWWMEVMRTDPTEAATSDWYDYSGWSSAGSRWRAC
jgi:hypothetical protein